MPQLLRWTENIQPTCLWKCYGWCCKCPVQSGSSFYQFLSQSRRSRQIQGQGHWCRWTLCSPGQILSRQKLKALGKKWHRSGISQQQQVLGTHRHSSTVFMLCSAQIITLCFFTKPSSSRLTHPEVGWGLQLRHYCSRMWHTFPPSTPVYTVSLVKCFANTPQLLPQPQTPYRDMEKAQ